MQKKELLYLITHKSCAANEIFSFSQDGEDILLRSLFPDVDSQKGFYVDIGAHHPMRFSNTFYFYLHGWRGINIDATPGSMKLFKKYRKRDINLEIGISDKTREMTFYEFYEPALNTFDRELAQEYMKQGAKLLSKQNVKTFNIMEILDKYVGKKKIDFLDIDIEGLDDLVLQNIDYEKYHPKCILAEKKLNLEANKVQPNEILSQNGYELVAMTSKTGVYRRID